MFGIVVDAFFIPKAEVLQALYHGRRGAIGIKGWQDSAESPDPRKVQQFEAVVYLQHTSKSPVDLLVA